MTFPTPIFAADDWLAVWMWPAIMALAFGVFARDRDVVQGGDRRPLATRFLASFVLYGSVWIPFQVISDAITRGAEAQGFDSPAGWGFGIGLACGVIAFLALLAVAAKAQPIQTWLGFGRNPFKSAGKS